MKRLWRKMEELLYYWHLTIFADVCLMYKLFHDLAPPPFKQCVTFCKYNIRQTRSPARGDCSTTFKKTVFGQSAFSVRAAERWNVIPVYVRAEERWNVIPVYIRACTTLSIFKTMLKENQICDHWESGCCIRQQPIFWKSYFQCYKNCILPS